MSDAGRQDDSSEAFAEMYDVLPAATRLAFELLRATEGIHELLRAVLVGEELPQEQRDRGAYVAHLRIAQYRATVADCIERGELSIPGELLVLLRIPFELGEVTQIVANGIEAQHLERLLREGQGTVQRIDLRSGHGVKA